MAGQGHHPLPPDVLTAAANIAAPTEALRQPTSQEVRAVDRPTDRATAERLLGPYEQQAAAERQVRRGKRKPTQE